MNDFEKLGIQQTWSPSTILLSYAISVTGSYCTIQLMERWREVRGVTNKRLMLAVSALALGGCGIWSMHFTGMTALNLELDGEAKLVIDFELGFTVLSFLFAVVGVLAGLKIASSDPYFLEMEAERRHRMLAADFTHVIPLESRQRNDVTRRIKALALFSRLWLIMAGGVFTALGVLAMHYTGMKAQRTNAAMALDPALVTLSVLIALVSATTAFWIIFRALTFMPNNEPLRLASALIMGGAISATHYCGMAAASYSLSTQAQNITGVLVDGTHAANVASHISLLACYWLTIFSIVNKAERTFVMLDSPTGLSPRTRNMCEVSTEGHSKISSHASLKVHVDNA